MSGRVVAVDPAAEDGDRDAVGVERAAVRFGVDPARLVANLERLYTAMWRTYQDGAPPAPIRLTDG